MNKNNFAVCFWISLFMGVSLSIGLAHLHDSFIGFLGYIPWIFILGLNIGGAS